jgi:hypothetical protein
VSTELFPSNGCCTVACLHSCYLATGLHVPVLYIIPSSQSPGSATKARGFSTQRCRKNVFWDVTPCRPVEVYRRFRGSYFLHLQSMRETSSILNGMNMLHLYAVRSTERLVDFYRTIRRHIQEDFTIVALMNTSDRTCAQNKIMTYCWELVYELAKL